MGGHASSKLKPDIISVAGSDGGPLLARIYASRGGLSVTRLCGTRSYSVTHLASGAVVMSGISAKRKAHHVMHLLLQSPIDWTLPTNRLMEQLRRAGMIREAGPFRHELVLPGVSK